MNLKQLAILLFLFFSLTVSKLQAGEIQVYAAASLTDALTEIGNNYEKSTGEKPAFNFAASNLLVRQIQEGAPADLFISADEEKMDWLEKSGLILKETRQSLLSNKLVIVVEKESSLTFQSANELAERKVKRIAIAEPQSVPAGIYAKKYLQKNGIWERIRERIIPTENVRAALAAVESGNVDAAIVYKTDASISKKIKIAYEIPLKEGPKISYPFAVVSHSEHFENSKKFLEYLASPEGLSVFKKFGFIIEQN